MTIDGYTQPGASANTLAEGSGAVLLIELDGSLAGEGTTGLHVAAGNSTVRGLVINRFGGDGIVLDGSGSTGNIVAGNYVGTDASGTAALGNGASGIALFVGASEID